MSAEVESAANALGAVVARARTYAQDSRNALSAVDHDGNDGVVRLLSDQAKFLGNHAAEMLERAAVQDQRAGQAAAAARDIADLAAAIKRLAGEARLLAVNARTSLPGLAPASAGFDVLASEMQRLSDEVAATNEHVSDLAEALERDLPLIALQAREILRAYRLFSSAVATMTDETTNSVNHLHTQVDQATRADKSMTDESQVQLDVLQMYNADIGSFGSRIHHTR